MPTITLIGADSAVYTRNLSSDILLASALQDSTIGLMDIDEARLAQARVLVQALIDGRAFPARVGATIDRREAVGGADYVVITFKYGRLDAYALDIGIPKRYDVERCVGDTLGSGGVVRSLRTSAVLLELFGEMDEVAPDALLRIDVNPMAATWWAVDAATSRPHVGLCHSVRGTSEMLARWLDVPNEEMSYRRAGINHQADRREFRRGAEDLLGDERAARSGRPGARVRADIMTCFSSFVTESSGHASEHLS